MCQFLYSSLVFLCIFLFFYVCFSVLELFWKKTEERSKNQVKTSKIGQSCKLLKSSKAESWHCSANNRITNAKFPFSAKTEGGNWQFSFLTSLAIKRTSKLIPRDPKTQKRMRELKEEEFLQSKPLYLCTFLQFSASFFFYRSSLLVLMFNLYYFSTMLG